jgi:hypothetical protein
MAEGEMTAQHLFVAAAMASLLAATSAQASVEISANPTKNMNCAAGVCAPTAKNAVLNATDLANMLATSDVKVVTGSGAVTVTVSSSFSWTSTHRVTLDASLNVSFKAPVEVAGQGSVTIIYNDGGTGGDLFFSPGGKLDFWDTGSSLVINGKSYTLVKDIASLASGISGNPSGAFALANSYDAKRDGAFKNSVVAAQFSGVFEGLGHDVSKLRMTTGTSNVLGGFFADIKTGGVVRDIGIVHSMLEVVYPQTGGALLAGQISGGQVIHAYASGTVFAQGKNTGCGAGLVALIWNGGTVAASHADVTVAVHRRELAGGLVCENQFGTITDSYATGAVGYWGGGLVGQNEGLIENSHATGAVFSGGGLVGTNYFGEIYRCYAIGTVNQNGGGLVGANYGTVFQSFATGAVNGTWISKRRPGIAGGLIGTSETGEIVDSYAIGAVSGGSEVTEKNGGLIGFNERYAGGTSMTTSYAIGQVTGPGFDGGVIGNDADPNLGKQDLFWDLDTSGISNPSQGAGQPANDPGLTGLTDAQLKSALPSGFDPAIWGQSASINSGYPYLLANPPPQ